MPIERILNIKFNKKQKASATALRWLLIDSHKRRQTGRTHLTLAIIIEQALRNPGKHIIIFDHYDLTWGVRMSYKRHIIHTLGQMLKKSNIPPHKITIDDHNYTLTIS